MNSKKTNQPNVNLNLNVRGLPQSATLRINELSSRLVSEGREVFKLGLGQSPFPVPESVVESLKQHAHEKAYLPVKGLPQLREAVAAYHKRQEGIDYDGEDVLIGPGSKELMFLIQLVYYGDLVIPTPSWVSYAPQASIIGRHIRWLPTYAVNGWRLTPDEIERRCAQDPERPRIIILNYPNNPSGGTYRLEELKALARAARRYRVILLSDEIYGELNHKGQHVSIARFYPEGTIISGGLSKWCGAGGWRLGTFTFPKSLHWLLDAMAAVASETFTATSAPIQYAAVTAFEGGAEILAYLDNSRKVLRTLGKHIQQRLTDAGAWVQEPRGGFYLFPDFAPLRDQLRARGILNSADLCDRLLDETGVAMLPGSDFGRPEEELTARIAYVDFDGGAALKMAANSGGQKISAEALESCCHRVVEGVKRLCAWLGAGQQNGRLAAGATTSENVRL